MTRPTSILAKERAAGFREGLAQAGIACQDDAFYRGQQSAWEDAPSRVRWFLFGAAISAPLAWWLT